MAEKNFFEVWGKESPETMKVFMDFAGNLEKTCGLDAKTFQLVYLGLQASRGAIGSVAAHSGFAKAAGATREEVLGVIFTTMMVCGINGVADCLTVAVDGYDNAPAPEAK